MPHPSDGEIESALSRTAGPAQASETLAHIFTCAICLERVDKVLENRRVPSGKAGKLLRQYLDLEQENVVELLLADAQWSEIRNSNLKAQKERIATTSICKTATFARLLLAELCAAKAWEDSERVASLVATSIHAMDPTEYSPEFKNDLRGEVMIELGNSRRRAAEWRRSQEALQKAHSYLEQGTGSRAARARLLSVGGSLEADRGELEKALESLEASRRIYEEIGLDGQVAKTLLKAANALSEPDPRRGLIFLDEAEARLSPVDPLNANTRLLRVDCLIWTGDLREAIHRLMLCERPSGERMQIRYRFIGARLLHSLGHRKEAERLFHGVVTDDLDGSLFKDAMLDLLYILKVHLAEGELAKAVGVCRRALNEALLSESSHDQLKAVWQQILHATEEKAFRLEILPKLKQYMSLHWKHPAPDQPCFF